MKRIGPIAFAIALLAAFTPRAAWADVTVFLGTTTSPTHRAVKGFAAGMSLLIVGFEFEYASTSEDETLQAPSLKTTSGNVSVQSFGLPFQLYATTGTGIFRERLGTSQETNVLFNSGGGVKVPVLGPVRARVDYRVFNLRGNPQHSTVQRIYAGANLAF